MPRGTSRLLVVDRRSGDLTHRRFSDIITYLNPGDVLVLNDTRVIRARLLGKKETGGAAEVFLLRELGPARWSCLIRTSKRMRTGMRVVFDGNL
ncbi:MAG TPA: S-adenosylmethionine:tRNA ribosyltransferase-isomerase, partial [Deltaproteobacteria bacterium]|nr:S-adenosylmethionine:tRNA ribosyltransferase-isomerase [Deltaproteobacteria bacterium]